MPGERGSVLATHAEQTERGLGPVRVLTGFLERLRGLLGTTRDAAPVLIMRCATVHTFGMRYALDLAFLSREGEVLRTEREVPPGRVASCRRAAHVLERPASRGWWPREGMRVALAVLPVTEAPSEGGVTHDKANER